MTFYLSRLWRVVWGARLGVCWFISSWGFKMNEQTKKELLKAVYNGALDVVKLAVRDWDPKARSNFYAFLERLKK